MTSARHVAGWTALAILTAFVASAATAAPAYEALPPEETALLGHAAAEAHRLGSGTEEWAAWTLDSARGAAEAMQRAAPDDDVVPADGIALLLERFASLVEEGLTVGDVMTTILSDLLAVLLTNLASFVPGMPASSIAHTDGDGHALTGDVDLALANVMVAAADVAALAAEAQGILDPDQDREVLGAEEALDQLRVALDDLTALLAGFITLLLDLQTGTVALLNALTEGAVEDPL